MSRPDIGFASGQVCMSNSATIADLFSANKLIKEIKSTQTSVLFPSLNLEEVYIKVYTDASYSNLKDGGSQGGFIAFLTDGIRSCPLMWRSAKAKRVVKSVGAAETMALLEGLESAFLLSKVVSEVLCHRQTGVVKVVGVTDNRNLFDSVYSSSLIDDKGILVYLNCIRQMVNLNEAKIEWVNSEGQISDVLTKMGASSSLIRAVLARGSLN